MLNTVEHRWNEGFEMGVTCQFVLVLVEEEKNSFLFENYKTPMHVSFVCPSTN